MSRVDQRRVASTAVLTMTNPAKRNAFDAEMLAHLREGIEQADLDPGVRAIVVTGAGDAFCAGGDVSAMAQSTEPLKHHAYLTKQVHAVPLALRASGTPTIAMINGAAVGAGLDIALACDFRFTADTAVLLEGYVHAGLAAGDGGAWLLPRLVGAGRALELLLTGRRISAQEAETIGLVTRAVPASELEEVTLTFADELAQKPPQALAQMKHLVQECLEVPFSTGLRLSANAVALLQSGSEHAAAIAALRRKK
ncbi:enoyl-CoA hydratase/isomerase family protein [Saccharopolyspora sp. K220]|uniref:enoyl-CoA hydratase/isomerase family protein n=1 Tax=Saccharopolyspora soli TaxID=2926618 RepID=UPI001F59B0BC|nr:enoyl-CoA hydratase/isomerase family protein [Saccharopolyspora soli]MCI2419925.1 enoyl-CoA hydratase/isomerase family protein [Saccharopolyspora soli]